MKIQLQRSITEQNIVNNDWDRPNCERVVTLQSCLKETSSAIYTVTVAVVYDITTILRLQYVAANKLSRTPLNRQRHNI